MILKRRNVEVEAFDKDEIMELKTNGFVPLYEELEEPRPDATELEAMTVRELRKLAKERNIELSKALRKQDIIELLEDTK